MNLNTKPFNNITTNKENAILWGQKMWFILTDVYSKSNIDKLRAHQMWLKNITLAVIYQEFLTSGLEGVNSKIDLDQYLDLPEFEWEEVTLAYLAGSEHLSFKYFEDFDNNSRNALLSELVIKMKNYIFYSLVKHFGSTSSGVFDELMKSINDKELLLKFDEYSAMEYVSEEFTLLEDY